MNITVLQFTLMPWLTVLRPPKHQTESTLLVVFQTLLQQVYSSSESKSVESKSLRSESVTYSSTWFKTASDASVSCGTMVSLTKLIGNSSSATERFSKKAVPGRHGT